MHERDRNRCVAVKGLLAGEHFIESHADGIDVAALVGDVAARLLRADVMHRTNGLFGHCFVVLAVEARNAEIHDLDRAVAQQHDVAGLYVTVYDPAVVRVLKRFKYLDREMYRVTPFKYALLLDIVSQRDTVNVFHDDKLHLVGEAHVVYLDDIRVGKQRYRLGLVAETPEELLTAGEFRFEDLYSNDPVLNDIAGSVNIRHAAHADKL